MISERTLQHPILTLMVFVLLAIAGLFTISNVSIALMPDIDSPYLMVSASYENAGPETVEKSVTQLIENALVGLSGLKNMTSRSSEGSCTVSLEFNYGADLDVLTNDVRDKLDRITRALPDDVTPSIMKMDSDSMPIMMIAVRGNRSVDDLQQIADDQIVDVIEQAEGVGEANAFGGRTQIVRVELNQNRLQAYGLTLTQVGSALSTQNIEIGGGQITEGTLDYSVRTTGEYTSIDQINNTVITTKNGYDVKLSDIGRAFMGYEDESSIVYINGTPGVYVAVTKQSGSNSVNVANAVYERIDQLNDTLPSDIELEIISDDTDAIRDTLQTLLDSAWQGLVLAVVILYIFLCAFKTTIIISISIPMSIIITILCMNFAGITFNMMTLTGLILGIGMIVDASIVMIDNIYAYRVRGAKPHVAAVLGSSEMMMSVVSGNLTTICVFVPFLFFMEDLGFMGQMMQDIIFTIVISLLSSLFVALFLVPVLAGHFLPLTNRNEKPLKSKFFIVLYGAFNAMQNAIRRVYEAGLKAAVNHKWITVLICTAVLIFSLLLVPTMRIQMMTGGSDDQVRITLTMPTGTTLEETQETTLAFEQIVKDEVQGYDYIITSIGSRGRSGGSNTGQIQIRLPESSQQIDTADDIRNKLRPHIPEFSGVEINLGQSTRQQMTGDDIDVVLRSDSLDDALEIAHRVTDVMAEIPDIGEYEIDTEEGLPQVEIEIDRQRAYNFGVSVYSVANEIQASIEGESVTTYRENGEDYTVYVMLRPEDREKVLDLEQIYVTGNSGLVSVANVARVVKGTGPVTIRRENRRRIVHVTANIITDENANVVEDKIRDGIASSFIIPDNVSVSYEGSWQDIQEQGSIYLRIIIMAIILVFGVMAATYESFKAPIINLTTIPFLAIGVILIYKLTGQAFSMTSAMGLVMLVGIVVNNGIILVDQTNLLINRGVPMKRACFEAAASRLRPVLMTTLTTILGMLPMCFATSGSAGMVQPIGLAVVGGLTSSTFITLYFIPAFYEIVMKEKKHEKSNIAVDLPALEDDDSFKTSHKLASRLDEDAMTESAPAEDKKAKKDKKAPKAKDEAQYEGVPEKKTESALAKSADEPLPPAPDSTKESDAAQTSPESESAEVPAPVSESESADEGERKKDKKKDKKKAHKKDKKKSKKDKEKSAKAEDEENV